jgi:O-acetyl-ADP-ribose deacetylase (regulator of RNase III)
MQPIVVMGGGGVDGAIHRAGGKRILEECMLIRSKQGGCETGKAVITTGGNLPAKYVIHTVGPVWNDGKIDEKTLLSNCYCNSLRLALTYGIKTMAFPNISTGIYRFPKELAAETAISAVTEFIESNEGIVEVIFVCFDDENYMIYNPYSGRTNHKTRK